MAVTDYTTYKSLIQQQPISLATKVAIGDTSRLQSCWASAPIAGSAPTTSVALSNSTTGAITFERFGLPSSTTKTRRVAQFEARTSLNVTGISLASILVDRLVHSGGLVANVSGAQTTNLPTAALTRYTSGEGVFAALEIYTTIGTTATTATVSYTNQAGTAGQTSPAFVFGGTGNRTAGTMIIIPLADGDTGVRSVESVNLNATTGTAGNFGVTLFKILDWVPGNNAGFDRPVGLVDAFTGGGGLCPVVEDNACLQLCAFSGATTVTAAASLRFIEDDA